MQSKKKKPKEQSSRYVILRSRFTPEELDVIKAAAAHRGLGLNLFLRLVSVGISKRVLEEASREELVGRYLDAGSMLLPGRQPLQTALD